MLTRRRFVLAAGAAGLVAQKGGTARSSFAARKEYTLDLQVPTRRYDGKTCWCHPRAGVVPGAGSGGLPRVVMTMNTLDVSGSDVFKAVYGMETSDLGKNWTKPSKLDGLALRFEDIEGQERPVAVSDFWPAWHAQTRTLLGTGHTVVYTSDWKIPKQRPRHTVYATYDAQTHRWNPWKKLAMPAGAKFADAGAGCTQRWDDDDGTILLPIYFRPPQSNSRVTVLRCRFDGRVLSFVEHGTELKVDDNTRGLHEPSLTRCQGRWYLTIRNDRRGYVATSDDGLHYSSMRPWQFDDGSDLGNYNTQQHWVTHGESLYLVYTR